MVITRAKLWIHGLVRLFYDVLTWNLVRFTGFLLRRLYGYRFKRNFYARVRAPKDILEDRYDRPMESRS